MLSGCVDEFGRKGPAALQAHASDNSLFEDVVKYQRRHSTWIRVWVGRKIQLLPRGCIHTRTVSIIGKIWRVEEDVRWVYAKKPSSDLGKHSESG